MNHSEIAHRWAQDDGACLGRNSNVSCASGVLYSYATAIGQFFTARDGSRMVAVNLDNYSVSTCKHQGHMRSAINHIKLPVRRVSMGTSTLIPTRPSQRQSLARGQVKACLEEALRHQTSSEHRKAEHLRELDLGLAAKAVEDARLWRELFDKRIAIPSSLDKIFADMAKWREAERRQERARKKQAEAREKERLVDWMNGEAVYGSFYGTDRVYLRSKGGNVETSHGASVPVEAAKRLLTFALKVREKGWQRNGEQFEVGHYSLDRVNEQGVIIGCHRISFEEGLRLAKQEGWM